MKFGFLILAAIFSISNIIFAQPPRNIGGAPEWAKIIDVNRNGRIDRDEYRAAAEAFFKKYDKNGNGILEQTELPPRPRDNRPILPPNEVPPFLFFERGEENLTRTAFDERSNLRFIEIDLNGDGQIDWNEIRNFRPPDRRPPLTATATFINAEMRFGDKLVKDAPFSAETLREENKRLFDGSIVRNQSKGLIFRDSAGRIRQEQPFEFIGGFPVVGENNQPKKLVNLIDVVNNTFYSFDLERKIAFQSPMLEKPPTVGNIERREGKTESLGTKEIEGVNAEGTRTTIEIPIGQIGNDKPIYVITEKWFSPELQILVLSKHTDPFAGETVFRLVNIRKGEPPTELFVVPKDYKIVDTQKRNNRNND